MDITLRDLKKKVLLVLADEPIETSETASQPLGGSSYGAEILKDGIHAALNAICSRSWKQSVIDVTIGSEYVDLPADHINVEAVYDNRLGMFLPRIQMQVGMPMGSTTGNAWHLFPTGVCKFINPLEDGATIFYSAHWALPDEDEDTIEPPDTHLTCLILYAASYCLLQDASSSGNIRQFNTKVDSGVPSDIPAKVISDFLLARFERELQRLSMGEKVRNQ